MLGCVCTCFSNGGISESSVTLSPLCCLILGFFFFFFFCIQRGDASPENYYEEPAVSESEHRNLSTWIIPWRSEDMAPRKRSISEHSFAWMQKWISAPYLKDSGGEAVWSAVIYGWMKYTVIKIMRHRLILKNIQYSPTGTWKASNCDPQTNTKMISNCAQLGVIFCIAVCSSMAD